MPQKGQRKEKGAWKKRVPAIIEGNFHWLFAGFLGFELCSYMYGIQNPDIDELGIIDGIAMLVTEFGGLALAIPVLISLYHLFRPEKNNVDS